MMLSQVNDTGNDQQTATQPRSVKLSLSETMELIRWDMRVNHGWSFDHIRARLLLLEIRFEQYVFGQLSKDGRSAGILWGLTRFIGSVFQWLLGSCNIPGSARIGRGLRLPHPQNIVIAYLADIGEFCTIYHDVSIVWNSFVKARRDRPRIGKRVMIGAKAIIVGDVEIGDDVLIGAGATVPKSVPSESRVTNEPAKVKSRPITSRQAEPGSPEHIKRPFSIWREK